MGRIFGTFRVLGIMESKVMEMTICLQRQVRGTNWKKRSRRGVKLVRAHAKKTMKTNEVKIDCDLNKFLNSRNNKSVPPKVRVRLERKPKTNGEGFFTQVELVPTTNFHGLQNEVIHMN